MSITIRTNFYNRIGDHICCTWRRSALEVKNDKNRRCEEGLWLQQSANDILPKGAFPENLHQPTSCARKVLGDSVANDTVRGDAGRSAVMMVTTGGKTSISIGVQIGFAFPARDARAGKHHPDQASRCWTCLLNQHYTCRPPHSTRNRFRTYFRRWPIVADIRPGRAVPA